MYRQLWMSVACLSLASFGCAGRGSSSSSSDQFGRIALAIVNPPPNATCIQVLVQGTSNVERDADVTPGQSNNLLLEGLPEGSDTINVNAFSGSCGTLTAASVPTWIGDPVVANVAQTPVDVTVTLHPNDQNGRINLGVNFDGGGSAGSQSDGGSAGGAGGSGGGTTEDAAGGSAGTGGAGNGGSGGSGPADICAPLHSDPATCVSCEDNFCPHDPIGCPSACTGQPACSDYSGGDVALCDAVLTCIRTSNCVANGVTFCYCGNATLADCQGGLGTGACKAEIQAGLKSTNDNANLLSLTNVRFPAGGALSVGQCDHDNCGDPNLGGNSECVPFCK